jgi:hypothetical protein
MPRDKHSDFTIGRASIEAFDSKWIGKHPCCRSKIDTLLAEIGFAFRSTTKFYAKSAIYTAVHNSG